ncbi:MAG: hypothetical protein HQK63_06175 [Desulfamplus sp.]|nr:hypothetical protein [Desulfamplus sp.]
MKLQEYKSYDFCKAACEEWDAQKKSCDRLLCSCTAKQFHHWLTKHGYKIIVKEVEENENH